MPRVVPPFVLASASPRRRELLAAAGFEFQVISPSLSETFDLSLTPVELTLGNATRKALHIARARPGAIILGADTLVAIDSEVIGKPADLEHAVTILRRLSGRSHHVCSAVVICHLASSCTRSFHQISRVRFRRLDEETIREYIAHVRPLDKAGAYAAQRSGSEIIARIDGSFTNVVGLPMEETIRALKHFGIEPRRT